MIEETARNAAAVFIGCSVLTGMGILVGLMIVSDWKAQKFPPKKKRREPITIDNTEGSWWDRERQKRADKVIEGSAALLNPDKPAAPKSREVG